VSDDRGLPDEQDDELPPPVPPEARHPGSVGKLRRHRIDLTPLTTSADFRRLFVGQAFCEFGTQITFVAVPLQVYILTRSTAMVGSSRSARRCRSSCYRSSGERSRTWSSGVGS